MTTRTDRTATSPAGSLISDVFTPQTQQQPRKHPRPQTLRSRTLRRATPHRRPGIDYHPYMLPQSHAQSAVTRRQGDSPTLNDLMLQYEASAQPAAPAIRPIMNQIQSSAVRSSYQLWTSAVAVGAYAYAQANRVLPKRYALNEGVVVNWSALPRKRATAVAVAAVLALAAVSLAADNNRPVPVGTGNDGHISMPDIFLAENHANDGQSSDSDAVDHGGKSGTSGRYWTSGTAASSQSSNWTDPSPNTAPQPAGTQAGQGATNPTPTSPQPNQPVAQPPVQPSAPGTTPVQSTPPTTSPALNNTVTLPGQTLNVGGSTVTTPGTGLNLAL